MQPRLKILDVFYGNKCNLTCFQCDTRSDIFRKGEYDPQLENIKESINLAKEKFIIENYSLLGGEPLMYLDRVIQLVKFIRSFDQETTILLPSNGALLDKHLDTVAHLITEYRVFLIISDHFSNFEDKTKSNKIKELAIKLSNKIGFPEQHPNTWFYDIFDWDNKKQDPLWQSWVDKYGKLNEIPEPDLLWIKQRHGIYYKVYGTFQSHHYLDVNNKPKPYKSGDPDASYSNGCCSPFCTFMFDKKLYKCGALGTLKRFLNYHKSIDDPDWQEYLDYQPLDLESCTDQEVIEFSIGKYKSIKQCTMCPKVSKDFSKTPDQVLPHLRIKNV